MIEEVDNPFQGYGNGCNGKEQQGPHKNAAQNEKFK
jgi:hypothetical protein